MKYLLLAGLILLANISYAEIYVALDKESGKVLGTVDVNPENIGEWAKNYTMKKVSEDYRGKKSFEVILDNGKLRPATKEEISEATKPIPAETLSAEDIIKLKALIKQGEK